VPVRQHCRSRRIVALRDLGYRAVAVGAQGVGGVVENGRDSGLECRDVFGIGTGRGQHRDLQTSDFQVGRDQQILHVVEPQATRTTPGAQPFFFARMSAKLIRQICDVVGILRVELLAGLGEQERQRIRHPQLRTDSDPIEALEIVGWRDEDHAIASQAPAGAHHRVGPVEAAPVEGAAPGPFDEPFSAGLDPGAVAHHNLTGPALGYGGWSSSSAIRLSPSQIRACGFPALGSS
jgi:hypothetical protein